MHKYLILILLWYGCNDPTSSSIPEELPDDYVNSYSPNLSSINSGVHVEYVTLNWNQYNYNDFVSYTIVNENDENIVTLYESNTSSYNVNLSSGSFEKIYLFSFISLPFYDVFAVMLVRFNKDVGNINRKLFSILKPDQTHIHHMLLRNDISKKNSLYTLLLFYSITSFLSLIPIYYGGFHFIIFSIVLLIFILFRFYAHNIAIANSKF